MSCRRLPVFDSVAALLITQRTSVNGGVPAKQLSVPFCLISRATNRLRTSTRSLSPLLMFFPSTGTGFCVLSLMHRFSSVTSSKALNFFVPLHRFHSCFGHVDSPKCCSRRFVNVVSIIIVYVRISENVFSSQLVTYVPIRIPCLPSSIWFQTVVFSSMYHSHVHISLSRNCSKLLQCSQIPVVLPTHYDVHVSSRLFLLTFSTVNDCFPDWRVRFRLFQIVLRAVPQVQDHSSSAQFILARHSSVCFLSDHLTTFATQCCSEFRHHLLCDVDASAVFLVPGFRSCRFSLDFRIHHRNVFWLVAGSVSTSTRPSLQAPRISLVFPNNLSRFQRSSLFRLRMLRQVTTAALFAHDVFSSPSC